MTTIPEEWSETTVSLPEYEPGGVRCRKTIDLGAREELKLFTSRTTRVVGANDKAVALVVITRENGVTVPVDVNWEIQRAKNLAANKVRVTSDTTHEESTRAEAECSYTIA